MGDCGVRPQQLIGREQSSYSLLTREKTRCRGLPRRPPPARRLPPPSPRLEGRSPAKTMCAHLRNDLGLQSPGAVETSLEDAGAAGGLPLGRQLLSGITCPRGRHRERQERAGNMLGPAGRLANVHEHTLEDACGMVAKEVGMLPAAELGRTMVALAEPPILLSLTES